MMSNAKLNSILKAGLARDTRYREALAIVETNSVGHIWLVGGFVYRTLATQLYGSIFPAKDFDFAVEQTKNPLKFPKDEQWSTQKNKHGNHKIIGKRFAIDLFPLSNIHSIKAENREPSIENYLRGVPLTIQSIAWDIQNESLLGDVGIKSLLTKTISIHNRKEYQYARGIYGSDFSIEKYATSLNFHAL